MNKTLTPKQKRLYAILWLAFGGGHIGSDAHKTLGIAKAKLAKWRTAYLPKKLPFGKTNRVANLIEEIEQHAEQK